MSTDDTEVSPLHSRRIALVLPFEGVEERRLERVPLAARRTLDIARRKVSLGDWQQLGLDVREALVAAGHREEVDAEEVRAWLTGVPTEELDEPSPPARPEQVSASRWESLSSLGRYVVAHVARRGRDVEVALDAFGA